MAQGWLKIHKVPTLLRQYGHKAYDPMFVSLGPYHHGTEKLQLCEKAKPFFVQKFVHGSGKDEEFFYRKIMEKIADARNCYVEGSTSKYSDNEFAKMMLRDTCFLIYFMQIDNRRGTEYDCFIDEYIGRLVLSSAFRDIFLLENQIPFSIVTLLINLRYDTIGEKALRNFLHRIIWFKKQPNTADWMAEAFKKQLPRHLLEAFHGVLVGKSQDKKDNVKKKFEKVHVDVDLDLYLDDHMRKYYINFRSAKDLKARGIHFNPSPTTSLEDINFVPGLLHGTLQLPTCFITPITKVFIPNLIAYELCADIDPTVGSHVDLMKRLIESPDDVKELRENNILLTTLGSDEEVARFIRELHSSDAEPVGKFVEVKEKVQQHYHSRRRTWMAQIIHNNFGSPLAIIGWLAALLVFGLTSVQTIYTILGFVRGD